MFEFVFSLLFLNWQSGLVHRRLGEELQGSCLKVFNLFSRQFSVSFPDEMSRKNPPKPFLEGLKVLLTPFRLRSSRAYFYIFFLILT